MMKYKKHMISVVMDGIRDADMLAGYAEDARDEGERGYAAWFLHRAKERLSELCRDWNEVSADLKIREHEDDIAELLACHVEKDIERVTHRIEKI
ncbi:MAG: hypothetical protein ACI4I0_01110 [Acutalibacteraceae bacterium]